MKSTNRQKGQLIIFLALSMLSILALISFVVNVGLFVKAKINLQNAVDAAAYAGASTQARHLTNIAYLNWELRNNYKEWMFKYYVLGQISNTRLYPSSISNPLRQPYNPNRLNFRPVSFAEKNPGSGKPAEADTDRFNLPSVCIHFGKVANICDVYNVPGVPRFGKLGVEGLEQIQESFTNVLVKGKAQNCSERGDINYAVAMNWAYGTGDNIFQGLNKTDIPQIAQDRVGAWIAAVELGMRIRNLEYIINHKPLEKPLCLRGDSDCISLEMYEQSSGIATAKERSVKAFISAYRNLGGSDSDSFKQSFKLSELSPTPYEPDKQTLNYLLVPKTRAYPKYYLDLLATPVNFVMFYTLFSTANDDLKNVGFSGNTGNIKTEGACYATRVGIPLPSFLMGFVKNPQVMTYYAVKGEANFTGLFFPYSSNGIPLRAYAAAKPFGGRIGPRLFDFDPSYKYVQARGMSLSNGFPNSNINKSLPYAIGLAQDPNIPQGLLDIKGWPIPALRPGKKFWAGTQNDTLGGFPGAGLDISFAIPNMIYDLTNPKTDLKGNLGSIEHHNDGSNFLILTPQSNPNFVPDVENVGLYDPKQFLPLMENLPNASSLGANPDTPVSADELEEAFNKVRTPTRYEALNYLVPTIHNSTNNNNVLPSISYSLSGKQIVSYHYFAPLIDSNLLYESSGLVKDEIEQYIKEQEQSFKTFVEALKETSQLIRGQATLADSTGNKGYSEAADLISTLSPETESATPAGCTSIAGKSHHFFFGTSTTPTCKMEPLARLVEKYVSDKLSADKNTYYANTYADPGPVLENLFYTAYMPGPRQGATDQGEGIHPFSEASLGKMHRNFYSTRLLPMAILEQSTIPSSFNEKSVVDQTGNANFKNPLLNSDLQAIDSLKKNGKFMH